MKDKIIDYIDLLEAKARQNDEYYKDRLELYVSNQEKDKEIERLNNIINELEKYLRENSKRTELFECDRYYKDVLDKLKELKENK